VRFPLVDRLGISRSRVELCLMRVLGWCRFGLQASLLGGQVILWRNNCGEELLFTSSKVRPAPTDPCLFIFATSLFS
jgi:hypothetical protein